MQFLESEETPAPRPMQAEIVQVAQSDDIAPSIHTLDSKEEM